MTNTLHRFGDAESFRDDYVVFAIASKGKNDNDAVPKLKRFLELALPFKPVNLGDSRHGGALRPWRLSGAHVCMIQFSQFEDHFGEFIFASRSLTMGVGRLQALMSEFSAE